MGSDDEEFNLEEEEDEEGEGGGGRRGRGEGNELAVLAAGVWWVCTAVQEGNTRDVRKGRSAGLAVALMPFNGEGEGAVRRGATVGLWVGCGRV